MYNTLERVAETIGERMKPKSAAWNKAAAAHNNDRKEASARSKATAACSNAWNGV